MHMEYKWSKTGFSVCGLHRNSIGSSRQSQEENTGQRKSMFSSKLENLSFSKLIKNVERLLHLLVFQAEAVQNSVGFFFNEEMSHILVLNFFQMKI